MAIRLGKKHFVCEWCGELQPDYLLRPRTVLEFSSDVARGAWKVESNCHVHHITYENIGNENVGDLVVVCAGCHSELHEWINRVADKLNRSRRDVMDRLRPAMLRRLRQIHAIHGHLLDFVELAAVVRTTIE